MSRDSVNTVEQDIQGLLAEHLKATVPIDQDLFAVGLVTSMFAMELVVRLEGAYDICIAGADLRLDNFRTIERMAELVTRLREPTVTLCG